MNESDNFSNDNVANSNMEDESKIENIDSTPVPGKIDKVHINNNEVQKNNIIINNTPIIKSLKEKSENIPINNTINENYEDEQMRDNEPNRNNIEKSKDHVNLNYNNDITKFNSTNNVQLSNSNLDNHTNRNFSGK